MNRNLTARFRIVTPMFLGGAGQKTSSLRPPSIKGALRFWWRALYWQECFAEAEADEGQALRLLHARETELFGGASGSKEQQSRFLLRAHFDPEKPGQSAGRPMAGHAYLLGQGLYHFRDGLTREYLQPGKEFLVRLRFHRNATESHRRQMERALWLWGCLGGLGSRARSGYGSVALINMPGAHLQVPADREELQATLGELVGNRPEALPPFTAFSRQTRIDSSRTGEAALQLLDDIGVEMMLYRSWGQNGMVNGLSPRLPLPAERNFKNDHDWALKAAQGICPPDLPERAAFGLPHNYFFSSSQPNLKLSIQPETDRRQRRASPLLIHIHQFPSGECAAIQTLLPATFLPPGERVELLAGTTKVCSLTPTPDWTVITDYLDRFKTRSSLLARAQSS